MTKQTLSIKSIHNHLDISLIVAEDNSVWVLGCNRGKRLGVNSYCSETPAKTEIKLEAEETVSLFYQRGRLVVIHTSLGRLFISRVLKPSIEPVRHTEMKDEDGNYPSMHSDSESESETEAITESDLGIYNWPTPTQPTFAMAYTDRTDTQATDTQATDTRATDTQATDTRATDSQATESRSQIIDEQQLRSIITASSARFRLVSSTLDSVDEASTDDVDEASTDDVDDISEIDDVEGDASASDDDSNESASDESSDEDEPRYPEFCRTDSDCDLHHDFGLGDGHSDIEFYSNARNFYSVHFASTPGFIEPIEGVDEVTCVAGTVFFRIADRLYVHNWKLTAGSAMWQNLGMAVSPTQHANVLTYYQIHLPFIPDLIQYCRDFVYMKSGPLHHVLTSHNYPVHGDTALYWYYFKMENITHTSIYVDAYFDLYVLGTDGLYTYYHISKTLEPLIKTNRSIYVVQDPESRAVKYYFRAANGDLVSRSRRVRSDSNDQLEYLVSPIRFVGEAILIDSNIPERYAVRGRTLCINIKGITKYHTAPSAVFICDNGLLYMCTDGIDVDPNSNIEHMTNLIAGENSYDIFCLSALPEPVEDIHGHDCTLTIKAGGRYFRCKFDSVSGSLSPYREIILEFEVDDRQACTIDMGLVTRPVAGSGPNSSSIPINIETYADTLQRLVVLAETFNRDSRFSISYRCKAHTVSFGKGVKRTIVQDALSQFMNVYLIQHQTLTSLNLPALEGVMAPLLFAYGRVLHMAMTMTKSCLSIRLPLSLLIALKKREPMICELEYMAQRESPEAFERIVIYREDPIGLAECGYTSYEECLEACLHYDPESSKIKAISTIMAEGILSYAPIKNLEHMNILTLDYYLSGLCTINRELLISLLRSDSPVCKAFVTGLIRTVSETRLAILLRNWVGTSAVLNLKYHIESGNKICFQTCLASMTLPKSMIGRASDSKDILTDMLTTPVTFIVDQ